MRTMYEIKDVTKSLRNDYTLVSRLSREALDTVTYSRDGKKFYKNLSDVDRILYEDTLQNQLKVINRLRRAVISDLKTLDRIKKDPRSIV